MSKYHPSLFIGQDDTKCFVRDWEERSSNCSRMGKIDRHEIYFGYNKQKSIRYGLWVNLCRECHDKLHNGLDDSLNRKLKALGRKRFEEIHSKAKFEYEFLGRFYKGEQ